MAGRFAIGSIAGVEVKDEGERDARIEILDAEGFKNSVVLQSRQALDFSVHTQSAVRGTKGIKFGVRIPLIPIATLNAIVAAIETALAGLADFTVDLEDQSATGGIIHNIDATCVPDMEATGGRIYTGGTLSSRWAKDVTFRFITTT